MVGSQGCRPLRDSIWQSTTAKLPIRGRACSAGFTLVELLIVMAVLLVLAVWGIVEFKHLIIRSKLTSAANEVASHFMIARMEAIKRGDPVVVVPDFDAVSLFIYVDSDDDQVHDDDELVLLTPRIPEASGQGAIYFVGPDGLIGTKLAPAESVVGFTPIPDSPLPVAVLEPDGSIRDEGALRIGDSQQVRRNIFEIRVTPQATARVEMRKYAWDGAGGPPDFYPGGAGLWEWY